MSGAFLSYVIIAVTAFCSFQGFNNRTFLEEWLFKVDRILYFKEYKRLFTSGFIHLDIQHLAFNMLTLFFFGESVIYSLGQTGFLFVYFLSMLGGSLMALYIYRNYGDYSALGASGAVCGIVFASIAVFPGMSLYLMFIPIPIPAWLYGLGYVAYTIYGIRKKSDNIGHEAHLGGAVIGMLLAVALRPDSLQTNLLPILLVLVPSLIFITLNFIKPDWLITGNLFSRKKTYHTVDEKYNIEKAGKQKEMDRVLEKIHQQGMHSLTKEERDFLTDFSNRYK